MRVVVDTNIWVSYLIQPASPFVTVLDTITRRHTLLYSHDSLYELAEVLTRPKFSRYITPANVRAFLTEFTQTGEEVIIHTTVTVCRDPKDNMILALAVNGAAVCIISGDKDLLVLHPFEGIAILTPAEFHARHG